MYRLHLFLDIVKDILNKLYKSWEHDFTDIGSPLTYEAYKPNTVHRGRKR